MLEIIDLHKRYASTVALDGCSLSVPRGSICGFVGRNGAGKTTAMRIALGVLAADSGEVRWDGRPIDAAARRRIGYMPEERGLYPKMRVHDHLRYLAQLHGATSADAADATSRLLDELAIADRARAAVETLSLGNQQRVQLAAALVHDPDVLVLDEPFSGLDPVGVEVMSGVLRTKVDAGVPVLFSSHQLELVERLCDSVAIIEAGRIIAAGTVDELRGSSGRRVRVVVDAPPGWADGLERAVPGVLGVHRDAGAFIVELDDHADDQALLDAARAAGAIREFGPDRTSLTELFRSAVAA